MKFVPTRLLILLAILFPLADSYAAPAPPPPNALPPPPPGLPVDGSLFVLLAVSMVYGLFTIYQKNLNKKTPV